MFKYTRKHARSKITIVATDPYGNVYKGSDADMIKGDVFKDPSIYDTARPPVYDLDPVWEYYQ